VSWLEKLSAALNAPEEGYDQAAREAPPEVVADGLSQAFRSDRTPAFPQMVANLFGRSDPNQRAGLLNRLLGAVGPGAMAGLPGALGGLLGSGEVRPEQAAQVSPRDVEEIAAQAEKQDPSVIDQVSSFYSKHPQVVQALGGLALTIAMQHMMKRR
jgi:hypothetical protein